MSEDPHHFSQINCNVKQRVSSHLTSSSVEHCSANYRYYPKCSFQVIDIVTGFPLVPESTAEDQGLNLLCNCKSQTKYILKIKIHRKEQLKSTVTG